MQRAFPAPDGQFRTFSLQVQRHADGTVSGSFQYNNHGVSSMGQGIITCFTVIGNQAWLGGEFVRSDIPALVGLEAAFIVIDNGEGKNATADQISFIASQPAGSGLAQAQCDFTPQGLFLLHDVEKGNIQIR